MRFFGRGSALPRLAHAAAGDEGGGGGQGNGGSGDGEGGQTAWSNNLPEDVQGWDEVKNSDSPEKFWDQMVNMRSRMGSSIRIPGEDAGTEDMSTFHEKLRTKVPGLMVTPDFEKDDTLQDLYTKMGRPAEAKEYIIPEFKDSMGKEIPGLDLSLAEEFKDMAHKAGLSQAKYADIVSSITKGNIAKYEQLIEAQQADHDKLSQEWGVAHERNSKIVENFIAKSNAPESVTTAMKNGLMDRNTMVWLHQIATQTLGKGADFQGDTSNSGVMTPDEATLKISEIRNNKEHPYHRRSDPGHAAAMQLMRSLYLLKNPKTGTNSAPGSTFQIGGNAG